LKNPLFIKPNFEGSGIGIHQDSVVRTPEEAKERIDSMLKKFSEGVNVEEYIEGRELTVPMFEAWPGHLLEIVGYMFSDEGLYNVFDYERKKDHEDGQTAFQSALPAVQTKTSGSHGRRSCISGHALSRHGPCRFSSP